MYKFRVEDLELPTDEEIAEETRIERLRRSNTRAAQTAKVKARNALGQLKRAASGWSTKMLGNTNGAGKRTKKIVQPEYANQARSEKLTGIVRENLRGVPKPKLTCPHCNKTGGKPQMIQFHFDKCKLK